ncbi:hypothetical protein R0L47_13495 [Pectobacterium polonicum]|uniref:hypothetical protein n=1 Tax=Pectobacterium polonicum TaxID=2485124 RepID=UPI0010F96AEE|nr:hypothetical protein [Pectobacterium polonicum]
MSNKPNSVLLTEINNNAHSEEKLKNQRGMVVSAISAWSPGGDCYKDLNRSAEYCNEQKEYFVEALRLIDKHLRKFNRQAA